MNIVQRLVLIVLLAAIPVGVLQGFSLRERYRDQREEISRSAFQTARRAGAEQDRIIDGARQLLAALAQLPAVREGSPEQCSLILKRLQAQFPIYLGIGVSNAQGRVWCSSIVPGTIVSDRLYFRRAVATRQFTTGGYVVGRVSGQRSLNFSLPFEHPSGELAGVLIAALDLDLLARDLTRAQLPQETSLVIAGPDRRVLVDLPGSARVGEKLPKSLNAVFDAKRGGTTEAQWLDGRARVVGFVPPGVGPGGPFLIAVGIDRTRALALVSRQGMNDAAWLAITVMAALLLASWFATRFVRSPVRHLASTVRSWREGDAAARVGRLDPGSEFDDLGRAFDAMAEAMEERQQRLRAVLESTTDSVLTLSPDWTVTFLNERARARLHGADLLGRNVLHLFPDFAAKPAYAALHKAMADRQPVVVDFDYQPLSARFEINAFPTPDGGLTLFIRDVTEQHRAREELRYLALHDSLTGLPNRNHAMATAVRKIMENQLSAIILIDLDGFKDVNDSYGHLTGDEMLRRVAERLSRCVDGNAMIARLGGDEFVALLFDVADRQGSDFGREIVDAMAHAPFLAGGRLHDVTTSCGVVLVGSTPGETIEDLLVNADLALYRAKAAGGGTCCTYTAEDRGVYEERRLLEDQLGQAVGAGEFELHYQPQVRLSDGEWVGAEALLRWRHPERGLLSPAAFMTILEHSRHARAVGEWVLDEACREAAGWWRAGRRLRVGVNLFAEQTRSGDLPGIVRQVLGRHALPAEALELELTETIALSQEDEITSKLLALRTLGVRLAFDDFGTGFASLTTLKNIPVHRLKIDRGFVAQLPSGGHDMAIVEAVLALARTLELDVIAEGVETVEQEDYLRSRGCAEAQGFRYAEALPGDEFRARMSRMQDAVV